MSHFSAETIARLDELISRYPTKKAALLPALWVAQEVGGGLLTEAAMAAVAQHLDLPPAEVQGVATFYTMYNKAPRGKFAIEICHNVPCMAFGAEELIAHCERQLGVAAGETTPDGQITLARVECLGACCNAPAVQIGAAYYEDVTPVQIDALIARLRAMPENPDHTPQGKISETATF